MTTRWSPEAADDFANIVSYIHAQNRSAGQRVASRIYQAVSGLIRFPQKGRHGRLDGTRELVLAPLPYIVVYRILKDAIEVVRVLHGAQRWP